jgi:phosphate transport system protein
VLKINQELERIGDLAVDIAKLSERLAGQPLVPVACPLEEMSARAQRMVQESLDALVNLDADLARKVWNDDDEVDRMNARCLQSFTEHIQREPEHAAMLSNYAWVSGHLERVADHAANISKSVLYLIKGEIVRHRGRIFKKPDPPPATA